MGWSKKIACSGPAVVALAPIVEFAFASCSCVRHAHPCHMESRVARRILSGQS